MVGAQTMMVWLPPTRQLLGTRPSLNVLIIITLDITLFGIIITMFDIIITVVIFDIITFDITIFGINIIILVTCPDKSKFERRKLWVTSLRFTGRFRLRFFRMLFFLMDFKWLCLKGKRPQTVLACLDKSKFEKRKLWVTSLGGVNAKLIAGL